MIEKKQSLNGSFKEHLSVRQNQFWKMCEVVQMAAECHLGYPSPSYALEIKTYLFQLMNISKQLRVTMDDATSIVIQPILGG